MNELMAAVKPLTDLPKRIEALNVLLKARHHVPKELIEGDTCICGANYKDLDNDLFIDDIRIEGGKLKCCVVVGEDDIEVESDAYPAESYAAYVWSTYKQGLDGLEAFGVEL